MKDEKLCDMESIYKKGLTTFSYSLDKTVDIKEIRNGYG